MLIHLAFDVVFLTPPPKCPDTIKRKIVIIFLSVSLKICFRCLKEQSY